jgi:hypothetical protein
MAGKPCGPPGRRTTAYTAPLVLVVWLVHYAYQVSHKAV